VTVTSFNHHLGEGYEGRAAERAGKLILSIYNLLLTFSELESESDQFEVLHCHLSLSKSIESNNLWKPPCCLCDYNLVSLSSGGERRLEELISSAAKTAASKEWY